jgi:RHS repeat-associated protein
LPGAPSNRIFTFAWDADDRLRAVREGTYDRFLAKYDEDGLRRWKSEGWSLPTGQPVVNEYTWGAGGMLHSSNPNTLYVPGIGRRSNGQYRWFQLDWLGSTRSLTDAAGNTTSEQRYEAFGSRSAKTGSDPFHPSDFQWGGGWGYQTETAFSNEPGLGLDYMQQRYYDPLLGRFISPDPIGYAGGLNLYDYAFNDPVNMVDPFGLLTIGPTDRPWLVLDAETVGGGLDTGVHGAASGLTLGLYSGGRYRNRPGFGTSQVLGGVANLALTEVISPFAVGAAGRVLSKAPRLLVRARPGFARLPGRGSAARRAQEAWKTVRESELAYNQAQGLSREAAQAYFDVIEKLAKGDFHGLRSR